MIVAVCGEDERAAVQRLLADAVLVATSQELAGAVLRTPAAMVSG
jgi:hypothetical protein